MWIQIRHGDSSPVSLSTQIHVDLLAQSIFRLAVALHLLGGQWTKERVRRSGGSCAPTTASLPFAMLTTVCLLVIASNGENIVDDAETVPGDG